MATPVRLNRQSLAQPWGFRIHGGADFSQPLIVVKVTAGSLAAQNGLAPGDQFVQINGKDALRMKHKEAQDLILGAGNSLDLQVARAGSSTWKPQVQVLGEANRAPAGAPIPQRGDVLVNNQYNTPIGIYSEQSIAETLSAQSEVLAGGAIGVNFKKNEKKYSHENSEVYKMLQEVETEEGSSGRTPPAPLSPRSTVPVTPVTIPQVQLRSVAPRPAPQQMAQAATHISPAAQAAPAPIQAPSAPVSAPQASAAPAGGAGNSNVCAECERLIVGVFVRIKDKNLHVECFKCNTCGQSLKNIGYYNINNKLYCDVHAKTVARQNPGDVVAAPPSAPPPFAPMGGSMGSPQAPAPASFAPITPPKPFSLTGGVRPQSPNVDSYAAKVAPLPFHQSPTSGISHVTAPRSPLSRQSMQPQQQQQQSPLSRPNVQQQQVQQQQIQQQQIPQPGGGLLQQYSSSYETSSFSSSSVTQQQSSSSSATSQQGGSGLRVTWPPSEGVGAPGADLAGAPPASSVPQPQSLLQQVTPPAPTAAPQLSTFGQSLGQQQQFKPVSAPKFQQKQVPYKPLSTLLQPAAGTPPGRPTGAPSLIQQTIPPPSAPAPVPSLIQQTIPSPTGPAPSLVQQIIPPLSAPMSIPRPAAPAPAPIAAPSAPAPAGPGGMGAGGKGAKPMSILPKRGRGVLTQTGGPKVAICSACQTQIRGPFITANSKFYCPDHFKCASPNCSRHLMDVGFIEEKGAVHCEFCWESHLAPQCGRCRNRIKYECLNAIGQSFHPECFACRHCNKPFGNNPFFLEDGEPYCDADWNELFTTKCYACGFPIEAGDRWVEAIGQNYHSQCFNCAACKKNLEGQSFFAKAGRPFCKSHAR